MAVYPFYVSAKSSSRRSEIKGGARSKAGSMTTTIYQRDNSSITKPIKVEQYSMYNSDGELELHSDIYLDGNKIGEKVTKY